MTPKWSVIISPGVLKRLKKIPNPDKERLTEALLKLSSGPTSGDSKPLAGHKEWRLRVGGWRVIFDVDKASGMISVISIDTRGDVYK